MHRVDDILLSLVASWIGAAIGTFLISYGMTKAHFPMPVIRFCAIWGGRAIFVLDMCWFLTR